MPKKLLSAPEVPTLILERLSTWGRCIRKQRIAQHIRADDLVQRMGIARTTLRRMERGESGVAVDLYLNALLILGAFELAVPPLPNSLWEMPSELGRARLPSMPESDDDYF
jgi:transcriptional regulator with XRE-family HTH domain